MPRPTKNGIEYFSFDVDFFDDTKLLFVSSRYEEIGELVTVKLLCWIYKNEGYFTEWNDEICMLFTKKSFANIKYNVVNDIVNELLKRNFFNQHLYQKYGVLTSSGIQKRWSDATKRRKVEIKSDFDLISYCIKKDAETQSNGTETQLKDTETQLEDAEIELDGTETQQSKVKYSKVKKSKEEERKEEERKEKEIADFKNKIIDIEKLPFDYLLNKRVIKAVLDNKKNKFNDLQHLERRLFEFVNELKNNGVLSKTMEDFSSHFRYWHLKDNEKKKTGDEVKVRNSIIPIG